MGQRMEEALVADPPLLLDQLRRFGALDNDQNNRELRALLSQLFELGGSNTIGFGWETCVLIGLSLL